MKEKLLISGCLLGKKVRYDGCHKKLDCIDQLFKTFEIYSACPEVLGGLPIPRLPSEVKGKHVIDTNGCDVTAYFKRGAEEALKICKKNSIKIALLKERSPSCATKVMYDGSFTGGLIDGMGITTRILKENGISVFSEEEVTKLIMMYVK